jgi:hypothetical protein
MNKQDHQVHQLIPKPKEKKSIGVSYKKWREVQDKIGKKKSYNQKQRINYNEVFALINNIKGKLQEIEDV